MEDNPADAELLRRYADEKSDAAFGELVRRHLNLVYSVALRQVAGDTHLAEDVAQNVFTALARKAVSLAGRPALSGWLYRSAHFAASDVVRVERRRRAREQEISAMNPSTTDATLPADWDQLRPILDSAIAELDERDRDAVALRFFDGCSFADVGAKLRLTENAARMRVERALDKLHAALARRGVTSTAAALGVALANQAAIAAPATLAASVTGAALTAATASASTGAWAAFLTMSKINIGIVSALVLAVAVTGVVELRANRTLREEVGALQTAHNAAGQLQQENQKLNVALQTLAATNPEAEELVRLRARVAVLKARPEGVTDEQMKVMAACRNVGRATPAASLETGLWAMQSGDTDELMRGYFFPDDAKAGLAAFFAKQSEVVRMKYGTPERLLGKLWEIQNDELPAAFQVISEKRSLKTEEDAAQLQVWLRLPSGEEKGSRIFLQRGPDGWGIVKGEYPEAQYAKLAARIDQATGALHPTTK